MAAFRDATQENRPIKITSPFSENTLLFYRMSGSERLGGLFEYELEMLSHDPSLDPKKILGKQITISVDPLPGANTSTRYFNAYVCRFGQYGTVNEFNYYRATLRPWFWLLTRATNCRIFQQKTVPDIIKQVFTDYGFTDFECKISGYPTHEYCVQYRESSFNFISRLMEEEGIYYYFRHEQGKHIMVMADSIGMHNTVTGYEQISFNDSHDIKKGDEYISSWGFEQEVQTGVFTLTDYDFKKPKSSLKVVSKDDKKYARSQFECFDYPGCYVESSVGDRYVSRRKEEQQTNFERAMARSNAIGITTGMLFTLKGHSNRDDQNRRYLVTSVNYQLDLSHYASGSQTSGGDAGYFHCSFTSADSKEPFRAPRVTPKPLIHGAQTAVVVGPGGDEIYTDQYGRVKVHFHWDRKDQWESGQQEQDSSCWIRVSHPWAGKNWGMVAIPRIGQEVIVSFLEGDPDQPIITGRVYNGDQMPPYALPANMTQTGIMSRSSKGGTGANCNELRFEDKKGSEQVYLHAEKNQDIEVENDETHWVGHDRTKTIDHDEITHVKHDRTETVDNNETITIGVNRAESVGSNENITIGANRTEQVGSNETITIGANRTRTVGQNEVVTVGLTRTHSVGVNEAINVGGAQEVTVGGLQAVTVGATRAVTVGASQSVDIGTDLNENVGNNYMEKVGQTMKFEVGKDGAIDVGKHLSLVAGEQVVIKTGDASIIMKKDGSILIKGKDIKIEGSGKIVGKADGDMVLKGGSKVTIN